MIGYVVFAPADKTASTTGNNAPAIIAEKGNVAVTYNSSGIPPELFAKYVKELAVTDSALASFFKIMEEQQVPRSDLDSKLREIATQYKELLARVGYDQAAKQAIEAGDYAKAEGLLEDVANQHSLAAAEAHADNARLQRVRLRYEKAAAYWQKAAALLPEDSKKERARYLHSAGYDLYRVGSYSDALPVYEQSLVIRREIGDKAGEAVTSWNIGRIYQDQGDLSKAEQYISRTVQIDEQIGRTELEWERKALEALRAQLKAR